MPKRLLARAAASCTLSTLTHACVPAAPVARTTHQSPPAPPPQAGCTFAVPLSPVFFSSSLSFTRALSSTPCRLHRLQWLPPPGPCAAALPSRQLLQVAVSRGTHSTAPVPSAPPSLTPRPHLLRTLLSNPTPPAQQRPNLTSAVRRRPPSAPPSPWAPRYTFRSLLSIAFNSIGRQTCVANRARTCQYSDGAKVALTATARSQPRVSDGSAALGRQAAHQRQQLLRALCALCLGCAGLQGCPNELQRLLLAVPIQPQRVLRGSRTQRVAVWV